MGMGMGLRLRLSLTLGVEVGVGLRLRPTHESMDPYCCAHHSASESAATNLPSC